MIIICNANDNLSVNVFDLSGRLVHNRKAFSGGKGLNTIRINLGILSAGIYLVVIYIDEELYYVDKIFKK